MMAPLRPLDGQRAGEIQVEVFVAGDGINYPKKGQTVVVHYTGYVRPGVRACV